MTNHMFVRWRLVVMIGMATTALVLPPAVAHDHVGPRALMLAGDSRQLGKPYHEDWVTKSSEPGFCEATFGTGFRKVPRALVVKAGEPITVRLAKPTAPLEVQVQQWPRLSKRREATGRPTPIPFVLKPHLVGGSIRAWDIVVGRGVTLAHMYLDVAAWWSDEEGCTQQPDLGSQFKAWMFHARTS